MIPQKIHYCWFGENPLPDGVQNCIASWKKYAAEYEITEWNEENYDISKAPQFVQDAYRAGKWAFVSDYVRLQVVYEQGGVYFDTDVELLKPLSVLTKDVDAYYGFEGNCMINTGIGFASVARHSLLRKMMDYYEDLTFDEGKLDEMKCPVINSKVLEDFGFVLDNTLQEIDGVRVLPSCYLCPENIFTGEMEYTKDTCSVHHYSASWMTEDQRKNMEIFYRMKRKYGPHLGKVIGYICTLPLRIQGRI